MDCIKAFSELFYSGAPLLSMTGHGEGYADYSGGGTICAEGRCVNNRHLKISLRTSEGLGATEPAIEGLVRSTLHRGALQLNVAWRNRPEIEVSKIQQPVVESYVRQFRQLSAHLGIESVIRWSDLTALPGVVAEPFLPNDRSPGLEAAVLQAVQQALSRLQVMRSHEGAAMADEFRSQLEKLRILLDHVETRAPQVIVEYRSRLKARVAAAVAEALSDSESPIQDSDLVREVALMCDKTDVREEIVRLRSHFSQFEELLSSTESQGRRLDFLVQEMFREVNTIGSKASDAAISQRVVEMKATMEQIREMIQNVE